MSYLHAYTGTKSHQLVKFLITKDENPLIKKFPDYNIGAYISVTDGNYVTIIQ